MDWAIGGLLALYFTICGYFVISNEIRYWRSRR